MKDFFYRSHVYYSPVELAMAFIGGTWKMPVLLALRNGPVRYGDLKNLIPHISHKMLNSQLRELEEKGMVTRHIYIEKPPRVEYRLTAKAEKALPVIDVLGKYGEWLMGEEGIATP